MSETAELISPLFPFHFEIPLRHTSATWGKTGIELDETFRIPSFPALLEQAKTFADFRMGWSAQGFFIDLTVRGKKFTPWCRPSLPDASDGLQLFLGLRDTQALRRANRYCHLFVFMPTDQPSGSKGPRVMSAPIARAQENAPEVNASELKVLSRVTNDGYQLRGWIPAQALVDFRPQEVPHLGFNYIVIDRELGWQPLSLGPLYPPHDPSLWGRLRLASPPASTKRRA